MYVLVNHTALTFAAFLLKYSPTGSLPSKVKVRQQRPFTFKLFVSKITHSQSISRLANTHPYKLLLSNQIILTRCNKSSNFFFGNEIINIVLILTRRHPLVICLRCCLNYLDDSAIQINDVRNVYRNVHKQQRFS